MGLVLGIDAAWSAKNPSGVALVATGPDLPRLIRAAPSYQDFVCNTQPEDWGERVDPRSSLSELLIEARLIGGESLSVIAVDMPVARTPVRSRRCCDKVVSTTFGASWCSTHSPTKERPGTISDAFYRDSLEAGFSLRTNLSDKPGGALLEVYPHVALLKLFNAERRLPYKLSKRGKTFRHLDPSLRLNAVMDEWEKILACLRSRIDVDLKIDRTVKASRAKAWEDVIDAIICCWVGLEWLADRAEPYGDEDAAIWVPMAQPTGES